MKKYLILLLFVSTFGFAQNTTLVNKIKITGATKKNDATRVLVQDSISKGVHWVLKSSFGGGGSTPTLNEVLVTGNQSLNKQIVFKDVINNTSMIFDPNGAVDMYDDESDFESHMRPVSFSFTEGAFNQNIKPAITIGAEQNFFLPNKGAGDYTFATTLDIPTLESVTNTGDTTNNAVHLDGGFDITNADSYFKVEKNPVSGAGQIQVSANIVNDSDDTNSVLNITSSEQSFGTFTDTTQEKGTEIKTKNGSYARISAYSDSGDKGSSVTSEAAKATMNTYVLDGESTVQSIGKNVVISSSDSGTSFYSEAFFRPDIMHIVNSQGDIQKVIKMTDDGMILLENTEVSTSIFSRMELSTGTMVVASGNGTYQTSIGVTSEGVTVSSDSPTSRGITGNYDYSGNIGPFDYPQKNYVDDNKLAEYTVSTLPTPPTAGMTVYVTDALAPAYLTFVVGGGSVKCPVFFNGSSWVCH